MYATIYQDKSNAYVDLEKNGRMTKKFYKDVLATAFMMACTGYEFSNLRINFYRNESDNTPVFHFDLKTINYGEEIKSYLLSSSGIIRVMTVAS